MRYRLIEPMHELRSGDDPHGARQLQSLRIRVGGRVQGVGFRPFVYRLARRLGVHGWVRNAGGWVDIVATAPHATLAAFIRALTEQAPPIAQPRLLSSVPAPDVESDRFEIRHSTETDAAAPHLPPDYFLCEQCLAELNDPADRRYRYPFINCTQCGPRYTLIQALPYDRVRTSMRRFALCPRCETEYQDPLDRRFHAEPLACPACGPQLTFQRQNDHVRNTAAALQAAVENLRAGAILAVKGIGGYHLLCDAAHALAVRRLRERKPRPDKPLAVLFPQRGADGLDEVRRHCELEPRTAAMLLDPTRPIVLLPRRNHSGLAPELTPGLTELGCLLPYSPLHHLLSAEFGAPLVATSANVAGEPVLSDETQAQQRLAGVADAFLHHDRPILRPADDSVMRPLAGAVRTLRLGRGIAPLEWTLDAPVREPILAVGGHMKNTVALAWDRRLVVSPHIGDLDAPRSREVFARVIADLQQLYGVRAHYCAHDAHPGYASSIWARNSDLATLAVPHHRAHAAALAGEYPHEPRWLVFTWDGTGLGEDGSLWGGEALLGRPGDWRRVASMRRFRLPGGDQAGRQPWRAAAAVCWEAGLSWSANRADIGLLHQAWRQGVNSPESSAVGRLFDAAASLLGLLHQASFEGQGPMLLEAIAEPRAQPVALPWHADRGGVRRCDWAALLPMLTDSGQSQARRAGRFHASLAHALCDIAVELRRRHGDFAVGLGGGVFQNRLLAETALDGLRRAGLRAYLPATVPCNDGGLSFGQLIEARALLAQSGEGHS